MTTSAQTLATAIFLASTYILSAGNTNIVKNGDFAIGDLDGLPQGWAAVCPNPATAPKFHLEIDGAGHRCLTAQGNGRDECFGYVRQKVHFSGGKFYEMRVRLHCEGLDDLNRNLVHGVFGQFSDGIFAYRREGADVVGENTFAGPEKAQNSEVRLYFRYSPTGKVWWEQVSLQECPPLPARPVKIACSWGGGDMLWWSKWLDAAGEKKADVALLLENFNGKGPSEPETSNGPAATLLSEKARQWHMYVTGTYYEQRDGLVYNTARLFDREGKLAGIYSKMQIYEPEPEEGVTPGKELPVFDTDFGKVGIMICYDSWFPEVARLLAYKGAELVLFPSAGYYPALMPARAADYGLCIAASSAHDIPGIWDSSGALAGDDRPDPARRCATAISNFQEDPGNRMIVATVDLARHYSPAWHGGPMRSAPGGRRVRQTLIYPIEENIAREASRWWTNSQ